MGSQNLLQPNFQTSGYTAIDHLIAFALLAAIGGRKVHASLAAGANDDVSIPLITGWGLARVALATSIDAAAA